MTVAKLNLCKELYELSGWDSKVFIWNGTTVIYQDPEFKQGDEEVYPAYDLGYLIRKLDGFDVQLTYSNRWRRWTCSDGSSSFEQGDNPEDAAAKLAIELFKQGVLHHE